ncbi:hypothetical protein KIN20_025377 [Parelaphostrongylus tenuis]|uniref:Uncharacterized protein n=1 Tax=Parelaphostrongylus tenuis TaxID=148309 RepID=A0AAD5MZG0_PARTN|nr:hypothetical protein KIN20_025377 [Parelaphostrongylus tenuis]
MKEEWLSKVRLMIQLMAGARLSKSTLDPECTIEANAILFDQAIADSSHGGEQSVETLSCIKTRGLSVWD